VHHPLILAQNAWRGDGPHQAAVIPLEGPEENEAIQLPLPTCPPKDGIDHGSN